MDPRLQPLASPFIEVQSGRYDALSRLLTVIPIRSKPIFERGGPLQVGVLKLVGADFATIDESRFSLPADAMSLDEIRSSGALFPKPEPLGDPLE
jgi:hypothetical protein